MKIASQYWAKIIEASSHNGIGSEKRITKMWVVAVLLSLTIADFIYEGIRIDVWSFWFGLLGWDGYRATKEKQVKTDQTQQP